MRAALLAALLVLVSGCAGTAAASPPGQPDAVASAQAGNGSPQPTGQPSGRAFPSEVAGLPVNSVSTADDLLRSGKLDGHAVGVAGYFEQFTPSCPYPGRFIGPLEDWCRLVAFTDTRAAAKLCQPEGPNGMSCGGPSGTSMAPFFMSETIGSPWSWSTGGPTADPAALVFIGHAGDARQWQCTPGTQAMCASAFVVDRIAWAEGHDVAAAPQSGDLRTGTPIAPRMSLGQVAAAIGPGNDLLTGAAFRAGDIATVDPRWNLAGDNVLWLVRSLPPAAGSGAGGTRPVTVFLIDDATGRVIDSHPLQLDPVYQPARMWEIAIVHGVECCAGDTLPFFRVVAGDGTVVSEGPVSGGASGGPDGTTYGGSYGSTPLVLTAGDYSITAWLATDTGGAVGQPRDECSTQVTLSSLGDVALSADFQSNKACTFRPAATHQPGS